MYSQINPGSTAISDGLFVKLHATYNNSTNKSCMRNSVLKLNLSVVDSFAN